VRPGLILLPIGGGLALSMAAIPYLHLTTGEPRFMLALGAAVALYVTALCVLRRHPRLSIGLVTACVGLGAVARLPLVAQPEAAARDAIRYVWDARVQRAGLSPYEVRPEDPVVDALHTKLTRRVDAAWLPTIYPPVAQLYFRAVTALHESLTAFRIAAVVCDALVALVLMRILLATGTPAGWVIAYAWHPLLWLGSASGAHLDFVGTLALTLSYLALLTNRGSCAAVLYVSAILVKPVPLVLLPLFWRRLRPRDWIIAGVSAVAVFFFVTRGRLSFGSLGTFIDVFRFNGPMFSMLSAWAPPRIVALGAVGAGLTLSIVLRARARPTPATWGWPMALALILAPVIYPWYLVWVMPFVISRVSAPIFAWTLSILAIYPVWHASTLGQPFEVPVRSLVFEFGVPLIVGLVMAARASWRHGP
jgi:hypothetical protein